MIHYIYTKKALSEIRHKLKFFAEAGACVSIAFVCRHYGFSRDICYRWRRQWLSGTDIATTIH